MLIANGLFPISDERDLRIAAGFLAAIFSTSTAYSLLLLFLAWRSWRLGGLLKEAASKADSV